MEKFIAKILETLLAPYFRGVRDEMREINERIARLEQRPPIVVGSPAPVIDPRLTITKISPCPWCGDSPCYRTHVIC